MTLEFMRRAMELALMSKGRTAPNPCVGAVLVRDGRIVAEGRHEFYGGPHAEVNCLADARARGVDPAACDLYVTLEPCNHHGKTPPCTEAVIAAGIRRVVVGAMDPNPTVVGGGAERLRAAGVEVETGVLREECEALIEDFIVWKSTPLPYCILKLATTLDGKIASRRAVPEQITGPEAMRRVQELRQMVAPAGAVLVGGGTFVADNPRLTCRDGYDGPQPWAVVATRRLPGPDSPFYRLQERPGETIFWTSAAAAESAAADLLRDLGCSVVGLPETAAGLDLRPGFEDLRSRGRYYVLCEGGGRLALSLIEAGLVHDLRMFISPKILGDEQAVSVFSGRGEVRMAEALPLAVRSVTRAGEDLELVLGPRKG